MYVRDASQYIFIFDYAKLLKNFYVIKVYEMLFKCNSEEIHGKSCREMVLF